MNRLWLILALPLVLFGFGCAPVDEMTYPPPTATPIPTPTPWPTPYPKSKNADVNVCVLHHLWYRGTPDWNSWSWGKKDNPDNLVNPSVPWFREIASNAYPLTGPYDSRNEEIRRWQQRQANAAGFEFFDCVYSAAPHLAYLDDLFFGNKDKGIVGTLQIAAEEHTHVGIEGWGVPDPRDRPYWLGPWKEQVARHLRDIESSPYHDAYTHIDGRMAYWLIWPEWMSDAERREFFDGTDAKPRRVTWLIRGGSIKEIVELNQRLQYAKVQYMSWSNFPTANSWRTNPNFESDLQAVREQSGIGMLPMAHIYTGFDERPGERDVPPAEPPRYGLRDIIESFLERFVTCGAKYVFVESFNEWGEGSQLEAGINIKRWRDMGQEPDLYRDAQGNDDPYQYLKMFAKFFGMSWVPPKPPPCAAVDSLIRSRGQCLE